LFYILLIYYNINHFSLKLIESELKPHQLLTNHLPHECWC